MNVTSERRALIETELTKNGVVVTDEAIAFVIDYMAKNSRATVASSARTYARSVGSNANAKNTRSSAKATAVGNAIKGKLHETSRQLADNMKNQVFADAFAMLFDDLENGDFGEFGDAMFATLDRGLNAPIEAEFTALKEAEFDPKFLLPAASNG